VAQDIANHESPWTTKLLEKRQDEISLDEIKKLMTRRGPKTAFRHSLSRPN
jgi:hypothetical protein